MSTVQEAVDVSGAPGASPEVPEAPERAVAADMARRSVLFAVPLLVGGALGWRWPGVLSVGLALALVLVNFGLGAAAIGWGARLGAGPLMAAALGGYVVRLGIVTAAVLPIRHHDWFELLPFAVSLIATHLGLLIVEARHVSASLAFPGLKPERSA
ncbi:MAG: ATP synthase subunit I [Acidimicrobiaceae bacterium]|nr:ATP synthase subunit I [Acidimicrobiaceae bacterium]MCY3644803.1 ATP synthase subunit I [Acidimicrobiaceae bacterium]MDE0494086.1 ATP synthase subunit I [Acidimicrobiaceae bacterium]MDE0667213.1 ATP synthase subunit I [Acidimicrobiaceae bacterium]MXW88312.1 ATP synthase subunit I [Acidimicrobiaceae bacterium]